MDTQIDFDNFQKSIFNNQNFNHQIKGKRLKREIVNLRENSFNNINLLEYIITPNGFAFKIDVTYKASHGIYYLMVDHEYPFNRPQIHAINDEKYGQCRDLLDNVLQSSQDLWGPSIMLSQIIEGMYRLESIKLDKGMNLKWAYHVGFEYWIDELKQNGVQLINVDYYEWRFMIRNTKKVVIGLTYDNLLLFTKKDDKILVLDDWVEISKIKEVKTILKDRSFEITINDQQRKNQKMYFGNAEDIQQILEYLHPIQMTERRIILSEQSGKFDMNRAIQDYSQLIEHYSLIDKNKTNKYVEGLRKLLALEYGEDKTIIKKQQLQQIE